MKHIYDWRKDKILPLMQVFDGINCSLRAIETDEQARQWRPRNGQEREAFEALVSQENRQALKLWYQRGDSINPHADIFRRILELATGEKLPLK